MFLSEFPSSQERPHCASSERRQNWESTSVGYETGWPISSRSVVKNTEMDCPWHWLTSIFDGKKMEKCLRQLSANYRPLCVHDSSMMAANSGGLFYKKCGPNSAIWAKIANIETIFLCPHLKPFNYGIILLSFKGTAFIMTLFWYVFLVSWADCLSQTKYVLGGFSFISWHLCIIQTHLFIRGSGWFSGFFTCLLPQWTPVQTLPQTCRPCRLVFSPYLIVCVFPIWVFSSHI